MILINSSSKNTVGIVQRFYPIHPPVGIGYLASYLGRNGIDAKIIDEQVEDNKNIHVNKRRVFIPVCVQCDRMGTTFKYLPLGQFTPGERLAPDLNFNLA